MRRDFERSNPVTVFIGHISALQLLLTRGTPDRRVFGGHGKGAFEPTRAAPQPGHVPDSVLIRKMGHPDGVTTETLHVNVADNSSFARSKEIVCHTWPAPIRGSYLRVDSTYCVLTPEACFVQMAGVLPLPQLLELANTLCGSFALQPYGAATLYGVKPLSTPEKLRAYVARMEGKKGAKNARLAAKLASAGSESPMEAKIGAMLALPKSRGGMGIPAIQNAEIELTQEARGSGFRNNRRPDYLWPEHKLAMDYESSQFHDAREQVAQDMLRRNELASMNLRSVVARPHHFKDLLAFQQFMNQILHAMGKLDQDGAYCSSDKRAQAFRLLFSERDQLHPLSVKEL